MKYTDRICRVMDLHKLSSCNAPRVDFSRGRITSVLMLVRFCPRNLRHVPESPAYSTSVCHRPGSSFLFPLHVNILSRDVLRIRYAQEGFKLTNWEHPVNFNIPYINDIQYTLYWCNNSGDPNRDGACHNNGFSGSWHREDPITRGRPSSWCILAGQWQGLSTAGPALRCGGIMICAFYYAGYAQSLQEIK